MSTFTWIADVDPQGTEAPEVRVTKLGDGYEHRQQFGINNNLDKWSLKFTLLDKTEYDEILAFLRARGALESFDWTPPDSNTAIKVVCRSWGKSRQQANRYSITGIVFEQVAEPS